MITSTADYERHFNDAVWQQVAATICARHRLTYASLQRSSHGENIIFFVDYAHVIKIFAPFREGFRREMAALEFAHGKLVFETPEVVHTGEIEGWSYLVIRRLPGIPMRDVWSSIKTDNKLQIVSQLGVAISELHTQRMALLPQTALNRDWQASSSDKRARPLSGSELAALIRSG